MQSSTLVPNIELDPFNCNILPPPWNGACQAQRLDQRQRYTAPGSCSRLPPNYQAFCRALPPTDPNFGFGSAEDFNAKNWPNTAAQDPNQFAHARAVCSQLGPQQFYNCLWKQTKYPFYAEFGPTPPLINQANFPCGANKTLPTTGQANLETDWRRVSPQIQLPNSCLIPKGLADEPKVWKLKGPVKYQQYE